MECKGYSRNVVHADCKIARLTDEHMEQKGSCNQKNALTWTWSSRSHQICRSGNSFNEWSIIFKRDTAWVHQASWKVYHVKARKLKKCYTKVDEKNEMTVEQTETVAKYKKQILWWKPQFYDCQFYHEITVDDWSSFLKINRMLWLLCRNLTKTYTMIMHKQKNL